MPAPASSTKKKSPRSSSRKQSQGPPREVIVRLDSDASKKKKKRTEEDDLLDDLLNEESPSVVSSLGESGFGGEHKKKKREFQSEMIDLDKIMLSKTEDEEDNDLDMVQRMRQTETPGLLAARERYKSQSASTPTFPLDNDKKNPLLHSFQAPDDDEILQGPANLQELSLGHNDEEEEEDYAIEVIDVEALQATRGSHHVYPNKTASLDDTSKTASHTDESGAYVTKVVHPRRSKKSQHSKRQMDNDDDDSSCVSEGTKDLLSRAHDRISMQKMKQEIEDLKTVIGKKNRELEVLAGNLRRAVDTKCDLVLAHQELEKYHEHSLQQKEEEANQIIKSNFGLIEGQADVEKDLINEIVRLKDQLDNARKEHVQELHDWERLHKNEMLERDCEIAKLKEEKRKLLACLQQNNGPQTSYGGPMMHQPHRSFVEC